MTRGSLILNAAAYSDVLCDEAGVRRVRHGLSQELRRALATMSSTAWYPRAYYVEVLRGIVQVHNEPSQSYLDVVRCGRTVFENEANTLMKLLLRGMSARLFLRKFPDFWAQDMVGGALRVDSSQIERNEVTLLVTEVAGFEHLGPLCVGFAGRALEQVTGKQVDATQTGWSFDEPDADELTLRFSW
jgi:hypothetical protein